VRRASLALATFTALAALVASCAGRHGDPTAPTASIARPAPKPPEVSTKLLEELALLTVGAPPSDDELAETRDAIVRGDASIESYVASLLADPRFARDVAPEIVLNKKADDLSEEVPWETLKSIDAKGSPRVYYLRKPCEARVAVAVRPWWAPTTQVLVCPDAYQPDHLREAKTGWYCGGDNLDVVRSTFCGCGPSLMNCARDDEANAELRRGLRVEVARTVASVVEKDLPIATIFTQNETFRTSYSELFYQRWRVVRGELAALPDLSAWPADGKLAPRVESQPGEHAGILTAPHLLLFGDTPRARMRNFYDLVWCEPPASQRVSTAQVLGLGVTDLRDGAGWKQLAAMPVCTSCHARLDYGMQFFAGFPSSFVGLVFRGHAEGRGPLYAKDIADPRGEAELTPRAFADLATKQPEFARCMARDVAEHVFGDGAAPDDARAIEAAFAKKATLKAALFEALVRYAKRATRAAHASSTAWPVEREGEIDANGRIVPSGPLRALLDKHCGGCHRDSERAFVRDAALDRAKVLDMLEQVAFRAMPKDGMRTVDRQRMVRGLVAALWKDEPSRRKATRYFGGMSGLPVERESTMLRVVDRRAGSHDDAIAPFAIIESDRQDSARLATSVVLSLGLAALEECKAAGRTGVTLDACVARAAEIEAQIKTR
jgi:hypothetical protein